jgi:hypothetical protein
MSFWSPKRRKYWGYKQNGSSESTEQEESDSSSSERPPMPWEPQDSTEDNTMYWKGEDSDEIDLSRETVLPTTVITAERTQPEQSRPLIDQIQGKAPEDINPENFVQRIILGMLGEKGTASIPKSVSNNVVIGGNSISSEPWNGNYSKQSTRVGLLDVNLSNFHILNFGKTFIPGADPEPWYGSFVGPGPNIPTSEQGKRSVNEIDYAASKHDDAYLSNNATGVDGALYNLQVLNADIELVNYARRIISKYVNRETDIITQEIVSYETFLIAKSVENVFSLIVAMKKEGKLPAYYNGMKDPDGMLRASIMEIFNGLKDKG